MLAVSVLILAGVLALLVIGLVQRKRQHEAEPLSYRQSRNLVLVSGIVIPIIILLVFTLSSAAVNQQIVPVNAEDALTIEVVGHRWWWEVIYHGDHPIERVKTANEIHIPVGEPVKLVLKSNDVIHSFWVPNLNGKTDLIPGRINTAWIQADKPGTYRGQCGEFCGMQHAKMAFTVESHPPEEFRNWLAQQRQPAAEPQTEAQQRGQQVFLTSACMTCHAIRGTTALVGIAPDLTHVASRNTLAAGTLPNDKANLMGWISSPQSHKPGNLMPEVRLAPQELHDLSEYLMSLE
jgi:cytochrome c oxidase subunit 2